MDLIVQTINAWGPPGALAALMWVMLNRSEKREALKDTRIQLLENIIYESYSERIEAANQIADAMHTNATALTALTNEIRGYRHA